MAEFNISDIFKSAFKQDLPSAFQLPAAPARIENSSLGGSYYEEDLIGREFFLPIKLDDYVLPFAVVGISTKKTLVETALPERGGDVTEMISIDAYVFNIKGILVNEDNVFPEADIIRLHKIFMKNRSLTMRSVLTDIFLRGPQTTSGMNETSHAVIVKEIKWPPVAGVEHVKAFEMDLKSDTIFTLTL